MQTGNYRDVHLHKEGSFLRAYDWSAWLCCHYLHDFKVNKRAFKGIDEPVAYIGFPETSLQKWLPEGAEQRVESEKHLVIQLPEVMVGDTLETLGTAYSEWKEKKFWRWVNVDTLPSSLCNFKCLTLPPNWNRNIISVYGNRFDDRVNILSVFLGGNTIFVFLDVFQRDHFAKSARF